MRAFAFIRQPSFAKYIMADIATAFRGLGWDVLWLDLEQRVRESAACGPEGVRGLIRSIQQEVASFDPALVLAYGLEYLCEGGQVFGPGFDRPLSRLLQKPAVHFFFDFGSPFDREVSEEADEAFLGPIQGPDHLFFCWDREALSRMKAFGLHKSFFFPMAVNPAAFFRVDPSSPELEPYRSNLVFAGGPTPERVAHLERVADLGLSVYGYGESEWKANPLLAPCWNAPVADRETLNLCYNAARISVNITRPHGFTSLNMRVYEAMAAGSLMLTDEKSDARELFVPDREIVTYRNLDELREKALWLLAHDREREQIAEAGRRRVLEEHTYDARARQAAPVIEQFYREHLLFEKLGLTAAADPPHALDLLRQDAVADAVRLNPDLYALRLAELSRRLKDLSMARRYARAALGINPGLVGANRLLETLPAPPAN